jgi:hypothetical protein
VKLATRLRRGRRRAELRHLYLQQVSNERQKWKHWRRVARDFEAVVGSGAAGPGNDPLGRYILVGEGNEPHLLVDTPDTTLLWGIWMEVNNHRRIVAQTELGKLLVSTVFLSLDHNFFPSDSPVLWETMVFGAAEDELTDWYGFQKRYDSHAAAVRGHWEIVDEVKNGIIVVLDAEE